MTQDPARPGERALSVDPGVTAKDAALQFIGAIRSPWHEPGDCPKNLRLARERGESALVEVRSPFRDGLVGLDAYSHVILLYWLDRARRDLIVQRPLRAGEPRATFALRSPVRPNPIGLAVVKLISCDAREGRLEIDAIDCLDGTPLIDVKPYLPSVDAFPDAVVGDRSPQGPGR